MVIILPTVVFSVSIFPIAVVSLGENYEFLYFYEDSAH